MIYSECMLYECVLNIYNNVDGSRVTESIFGRKKNIYNNTIHQLRDQIFGFQSNLTDALLEKCFDTKTTTALHPSVS